MKILHILFIIIIMTTQSYAAEFLVRAQGHWLDKHPKHPDYDARPRAGDIVLVRPDGWKWGKKECLPQFIVVRVAGLSVEDAQVYVGKLSEVITPAAGDKIKPNSRKLKNSKWYVRESIIDNLSRHNSSIIEIDSQTFENYINKWTK